MVDAFPIAVYVASSYIWFVDSNDDWPWRSLFLCGSVDVIEGRWGLDLSFFYFFLLFYITIYYIFMGRYWCVGEGCLTLPMPVPSPDKSGGGTSEWLLLSVCVVLVFCLEIWLMSSCLVCIRLWHPVNNEENELAYYHPSWLPEQPRKRKLSTGTDVFNNQAAYTDGTRT